MPSLKLYYQCTIIQFTLRKSIHVALSNHPCLTTSSELKARHPSASNTGCDSSTNFQQPSVSNFRLSSPRRNRLLATVTAKTHWTMFHKILAPKHNHLTLNQSQGNEFSWKYISITQFLQYTHLSYSSYNILLSTCPPILSIILSIIPSPFWRKLSPKIRHTWLPSDFFILLLPQITE